MYQFTENDLSVCVTQLRDFIDMYDEIPYRTLHFLTYDINCTCTTRQTHTHERALEHASIAFNAATLLAHLRLCRLVSACSFRWWSRD